MNEFEVKGDEKHAIAIARGEKPEESIKPILDMLKGQLEGDVTEIQISLKTKDGEIVAVDTPQGAQTPAVESESNTDNRTNGAEAKPRSKKGPRYRVQERKPHTKPNYGIITEDKRETMRIGKGTADHVIASLFKEYGPMVSAEVQEKLNTMPKGTSTGSLSTLYKGKILDRKKKVHEGMKKNQYRLSAHGKLVLEEIGTITEKEWVDS